MPAVITQTGTVVATETVFVGVDPGKGGAVAVVRVNPYGVQVTKMPGTDQDLLNHFKALRRKGTVSVIGVLEKLSSLPHGMRGSIGTWILGVQYGTVRMAMVASGIHTHEVPPAVWQKAMGVPVRKKSESYGDHKGRLKAKAQQLFPQAQATLTTCDAILLAEYARRLWVSHQ